MPRPPKSLILALDLGSSSVRTALFTENGRRVLPSSAVRKYSVRYSAEGAAELSPNELLSAARSSVEETLRHSVFPVVAVSGSAFWHSLLGLDRKGRPTTPIYTWADSRGTRDACELRQELSETDIQQRTGCMLRAPYWPAKLRWLHRTDRALFRRTSTWVSPASWVFDQLFGSNVTSHSMASGTGLYNLQTGSWDVTLCKVCHLEPEQLGLTSDRNGAAAILSAIGDGAAGNLGSGADDGSKVAINIGTSAAVRIIRRKSATAKIPFGLFKYVVDQQRVVVGGAISNGGNLHQWCLREFQLDAARAEEALGRDAAATDRLTVLPFWVQERAPTWPENLRGTITGLSPTTSAAEILRAATTSTFYRLADILDLLEVKRDAEVIVSGGILHSPASLKILADSLGRNIRICRELESSLRGAAIYALENLGYETLRLRPGKIVRPRSKLANAHRVRRARQIELERRLR